MPRHKYYIREGVSMPESMREYIARIAHEVNKAYCESLGDMSQPKWEEAPEWQRESATKGVEFHTNNPQASASASHDSWMEQKIMDGWVYGPTKDSVKKEHPCMVPFNELPLVQRAKDFLFRGVVHAVLTADGSKHE